MLTLTFLTELLTGFLIGWFIVRFPLFGAAVELVLELFEVTNKHIRYFITTPFECFKCAGFWSSLIIFGDPVLALAVSFLLEMWDSHINFIRL